MKISVSSFKGTVPLVQPRLLSSSYAQVSNNIKYDSGSLVPYSNCVVVEELTNINAVKTIYNYYTSSTTSKWLVFETPVYITNDPIYNDENNRAVITGLDAPRIFDKVLLGTDNTVDTTNSYLLGIPVPAAATIAVSGAGTGTPESRTYTIQYDRMWSDDKTDAGPMSFPATRSTGETYVDVLTGQSVVVSVIPDAPTGCGITHITVNRSASSTTDTKYQFVFTFNIADAKAGTVTNVTWDSGTSKFTFTDTIATTSLGSTVTNQDYTGPDTGLKGLISLNNGILAGYKDNYIYFCEPYQCHAWPDKYRVAIDRNVVGLGSFGSTLVVCTDAEPHLITLSDPAAAVAFPIKENAPCVSGPGIVSFRDAVVYPSYEGFIRIDSAGITNMTQSMADSSHMGAFGASTISAVGLNNNYYGTFTDANNQRKTVVINMLSPDMGFGILDFYIEAAYADKQTSTIYVVFNSSVNTRAIGAFDKGMIPLQFSWKSKIFVSEDDTQNISAARIRFKPIDSANIIDTDSFTEEELSTAIDTHEYNTEPINGFAVDSSIANGYIVFNLYADNELIFTKYVYNSRPFRLPGGYTASSFSFEIVGFATVYEVDLATSMAELSPGGEG